MKKLLLFYLNILIPIPFLFFIAKGNHAVTFVVLLLIYCLVYRPFIDAYRLYSKGIISREDLSKSFYKAPLWHYQYFSELYLKP